MSTSVQIIIDKMSSKLISPAFPGNFKLYLEQDEKQNTLLFLQRWFMSLINWLFDTIKMRRNIRLTAEVCLRLAG